MDHVPLQLHVRGSNETFAGGLTEASWQASGVEVGVAFERDHAPFLAIGEAVDLHLEVDGQTMTGHGRVHGRRENEVWLTYRIAFDREGTLQLGGLLNRREAVRVRPTDEDRLWLKLNWTDGESDRLLVHDLSGLGLSVLVNDPLEAKLQSVYSLRFELHLSPEEPPLVLDGTIRSRTLEGTQVSLGIHFEAETTPNFGVVQERIFRFVKNRYLRQLEAPPLAG